MRTAIAGLPVTAAAGIVRFGCRIAARVVRGLIAWITSMSRRRLIVHAVLVSILSLLLGHLVVAALHQQTPEAMLERSQQFVAAENLHGAKVVLSRILQKAPSYGPAHLAMAKVLLAEARQSEPGLTFSAVEAAQQHLDAAIFFAQDDALFAKQILVECLESQSWINAWKIAPLVAANDPRDADALYALAAGEYAKKNDSQAVEKLRELRSVAGEPQPRTLALAASIQRDANDKDALQATALEALTLAQADTSRWTRRDFEYIDPLILLAIENAATVEEAFRRVAVAVDWWQWRAREFDAYAVAPHALSAADELLRRYLPTVGGKAPDEHHELWRRLFDLGLLATSDPARYPTCYRTLAQLAYLKGDPATALGTAKLGLAALRQLVEPNTIETAYLNRIAAQQLIAEEKYKSARPFVMALRGASRPEDVGWGELLASHVAMAEGRSAEGYERLSLAVRNLGMRPIVRATLATSLMQSRQYAEAVVHLEALQRDLSAENSHAGSSTRGDDRQAGNSTESQPQPSLDLDQRIWLKRTLGDGHVLDLLLAEAHLGLADPSAAKPYLERLRTTPLAARAAGLWARYLANEPLGGSDNIDAAVAELRTAVAKFPADSALALQLVHTLVDANRVGQAISAAAEIGASRPHDLQSQLLLVQVYLRRKNHEDAAAAIEAIEKDFPNEPLLLILKTRTLLAAGRATEALDAAERLAELETMDAAAAHRLLARVAAAAGEYDQARRSLLLLGHAERQSGDFQVIAAVLALARNQYDQAFAAIASAAPFSEVSHQSANVIRQTFYQLAGEVGDGEAEERLDLLLKRFGHEPSLWQLKAEIAMRHARFAEAAEAIERMQALPGASAQAAVLEVRRHQRMGQTARALNVADRALAVTPDSAELHKLAAQLKLGTFDAAGAISHLDAAQRLDPTDSELALLKAIATNELGDYQSAVELVERLKARDPACSAASLLLAHWRLLKEDVDGAIALLKETARSADRDAAFTEQCVRLLLIHWPKMASDRAAEFLGDETDSSAAFRVAQLFFHHRQYAAAIDWGKRALSSAEGKSKRLIAIHILLGDANVKLAHSKNDESSRASLLLMASRHYESCLDIEPAQPAVATALMQIYSRMPDKLAEAEDVGDAIRELLPIDRIPEAFINTLLSVYVQAEQLLKAETLLHDAIDCHPDQESWLVGRVGYASDVGHLDLAFEQLLSLEQKHGQSGSLHFAKAQLWELAGNAESAIRAAEQALQLEPGHHKAMLLAARQYCQQEDGGAALEKLDLLLAARPDLWEAHLLRAQAYFVARRPQQHDAAVADSLEFIRQWIADRPTTPEVFLTGSRLARLAGDNPSAMAFLEAGQRAHPERLEWFVAGVKLAGREGRRDVSRRWLDAIDETRLTAAQAVQLAAAFLEVGNLAAARRWAILGSEKQGTGTRSLVEQTLGHIHYVLAEQSGLEEHYRLARQYYERILVRFPRHPIAGNNLCWMLATYFDEPAKAAALADHLRGDMPVPMIHPKYIGTFARAYRAAGQIEKCRDLLARATLLHPGEANIVFEIALTDLSAKKFSSGESALRKSLRLGLNPSQEQEAHRWLAKLENGEPRSE